jgi:hypothetical protein
MSSERNSFAELGGSIANSLRIVFNSKALMALFSAIGTAIAALYSYNGGIDFGFQNASEVTALAAKVASLETQLGESQALIIGLEERLAKIKALEERLDAVESEELWRDIDVWRGIVLSNAPDKRVNAMQDEYDAQVLTWFPQPPISDKRQPIDAARRTLGWGSVKRR